jgi:hypothetical protein
LSSLSAYRLKTNSPLVNRGVSVASVFGTSNVGKDFFGSSLPQGGGFEIGVNEVATVGLPPLPGGGSSPPPTQPPETSSSLPSDWSAKDIGSVGKAGSSSYSSGRLHDHRQWFGYSGIRTIRSSSLRRP